MTAPVLGLDLGTHCGWALDADGELTSGTWQLKPGARDCARTRQRKLWEHLEAVVAAHGLPQLVCHEAVVAHGRSEEREVKCRCGAAVKVRVQQTNVLAAHVYAALEGTLQLWCDARGVRIEGVPVGTLKLFATGKGNAPKADMVAWAKLRWRDQRITTDDQADALHVLDYALVELLHRRGKATVVAPGRDGTLALPGMGLGAQPDLQEVEF